MGRRWISRGSPKPPVPPSSPAWPTLRERKASRSAIADFAKSLLVIPKTLAVNAAKDASDLVAKLRAYHNSSQTKKEHAHLKNCGLDLYEGVVRDNKKAGVFEPAISKIKSLKFATEAAITILRIDDLIKLAPERGEEKSYQQAYADGSLNG